MVHSRNHHRLVAGVIAIAGAGAVAIGTVALPAHAQAPPIELAWNAPGDCPTQDAVLNEIARVLGHLPEGAPVQARAEVTRGEGGRWQAQLAVARQGAESQRLLVAESCEAIASATALIVAVAIEGRALPESPQTVPSNASGADGRPAAPPPAPSYGWHNWQLLVGAYGIVDDGAMPSIAGGVEVALGWAGVWRAWRVRVVASAAAFPEQSKLADRPQLAAKSEGGDFRLIDASGRACGSLVVGPFDFGPCVGSEVDSMDARGTPSATLPGHTSGQTSAQWVSLSGSALATWQFAPMLALSARVEGLVPLAHPRFVIAQLGENRAAGQAFVHEPSAAALRLSLGLEMRIF
jgi:hypothetical protein